MSKPTVTEVQELLGIVAATYDELDMRLKTNEVHFERYAIGEKVYKVGFAFDNEDTMTIKIINRTPKE